MTGGGRQRGFRIHSRFMESYRDLPEAAMNRVSKILDQLDRAPSEALSQKGCKKVEGLPGNIWEYRIDRGYRLTFMLPPGGIPYLLLVGHHDDILRRTGNLAIRDVEVGDDVPQLTAPRTAAQRTAYRRPRGPLDGVSDHVLKFMGVPPDLMPAVRGIEDPNEIIRFEGLSSDVRDCLTDYFVDGTIRSPGGPEATMPELIASAAPALPSSEDERSPLGLTAPFLTELGIDKSLHSQLLAAASVEALHDVALPLRTAQRLLEAIAVSATTRVMPDLTVDHFAEDTATLEQFYTRELRQLLLFLTPEQQPLVDLPFNQLHLLKGVAGSGKTTIAVYRARAALKENPGARVLLVTFTKALANAARELVHSLLAEDEVTRVEVVHLHRWMTSFLGNDRFNLVSEKDRRAYIKAAIATVQEDRNSKLLERDPDWFIEEISESIKGRGLAGLDEYLAVERVGRRTSLAEGGRRVVWAVYEAYQAQLDDRGDWDDYPIRCLAKLRGLRRFTKYDYVIVDEAQDLPPIALRLLMGIADGDPPSALLVADAAQSLYRKGFRWKDIGLTVRPEQVHSLTNNHRNTQEILQAANALLEGRPDLRDDGEGAVSDLNAPRRGPRPSLRLYPTLEAELAAIAEEIKTLRRLHGVRWGNIAVLAPTRRGVTKAATALRHAGVPCQVHSDPGFSISADAVACITLHSAKGLEFPVVFIADLTAEVLPMKPASEDPEDVQEAEDAGRKLLYVGMTRSMARLALTGSSMAPSGLLRPLIPAHVDLVDGT